MYTKLLVIYASKPILNLSFKEALSSSMHFLYFHIYSRLLLTTLLPPGMRRPHVSP